MNVQLNTYHFHTFSVHTLYTLLTLGPLASFLWLRCSYQSSLSVIVQKMFLRSHSSKNNRTHSHVSYSIQAIYCMLLHKCGDRKTYTLIEHNFYFHLSGSSDLSRSNLLVAANIPMKQHKVKYSDSIAYFR